MFAEFRKETAPRTAGYEARLLQGKLLEFFALRPWPQPVDARVVSGRAAGGEKDDEERMHPGRLAGGNLVSGLYFTVPSRPSL